MIPMTDQDTIIDTQPEPRRIPVLGCLGWLRSAFLLYRGAPLAWLGIAMVLLVLMFLSVIPMIGILAMVAMPGVMASFVVMADEQVQDGSKPRITALFQFAFRGRFIRLGVITTLLMLIASQVIASLMISTAQLEQLNQMFTQLSVVTTPSPEESARQLEQLMGFMPFVFACFGLMIVSWLVANTFAAPLLAQQPLSSVDALRLGFVALWRNLLPLTALTLLLGLCFLLASLLWLLGLLLLLPFILLTNHAVYSSIFTPHKPTGVSA